MRKLTDEERADRKLYYKEYAKKYYWEHKDKNNQQTRENYYKNIIKRTEQINKWRKKNSKKLKGYVNKQMNNPVYYMYLNAKRRAKDSKLPFTIKKEDLIIPSHCPILGIPLIRNVGEKKASDNSPSLDKVIPSLGYTKENIRIISHRANAIKRDATATELRLIADYIDDHIKRSCTAH